MKKNLFTLLTLVVLFTTNLSSQIQSNGTGGGDWNTIATWQGGVIPGASDNVVILGTDTVSLVAAGSCANLTLNGGATLSLNAAALVIPGTSWNFDSTSIVIYNGPTTVQTAMTYGNLEYRTSSSGSVSTTSPANLIIKGNFQVTNSTFRGISATSGSVSHTVMGNVIVGPGAGARITAVNQSSATSANCAWNIGGNLSLTGDNSGNRTILFESAGPHSGTAQFIIGGNLTIGTTSGSASQIQFRSSSGTIAYGTGIIDLKGNLVKHGKLGVQANSSAGSFNLNMIGTSNQSWSGTGSLDIQSLSLNVNINNPAGVTINVPQTIGANVIYTLTNGKVTTDATNILTIAAGSLSGGNSLSYIDGPLAQTIAATGPTLKSFPVGKGGAYRPVDVTITHDSATATTYVAEMFNSTPPANTLPGTLSKVSPIRYYVITKGAGATVTAASVGLSYDIDDGVTDSVNLRIAKDDGAGNWVDLGGTGTANITGSITSTTNFTSFSHFTLANNAGGNNPLPVELSSFYSIVNGNNVILNWSTATETNNQGFEIEKTSLSSSTTRDWKGIGFVYGAGNSKALKEYSFYDKSLKSGTYLYRLKQIDYNGDFKYSNELFVVVDVLQNYSLSQNYPNPFNPSTNIDYILPIDSKVTLEVYSLIGEKVADLVSEEQASGYYSYQFSSKDLNLTSGVYIYKLTVVSKSSELFSQSMKMILLK